MSKPTFTTIDTTALAAVTGGRSARSSRSAVDDERLMDKLESIQTAIKDVASQQQNKGNDAMSQMMPIIAMSMLKRRR